MAVVPGSGAVLNPVFNDKFGVDSIQIINGGSGYDPEQPPNLSIGNCGVPIRDAVLDPVIQNGEIIAVRVLDPGEGYDPLRVKFTLTETPSEEPDPAEAKVKLKPDGSIDFIQVVKPGDGYFYNVDAEVVGGGGNGASIKAVSKAVTGLSILNPGRGYETPPFLSITGGGGTGASGAAEIDTRGVVSPDISVTSPGQFYSEPPYILFIGGGGRGAKAKALVDQGEIVDIVVTDPGAGYTSPPSIVFTKKVKLKRKSRNRQSYNLSLYNLTGLTTNLGRSDTSVYVGSTTAFPGSGVILVEKELIRYTGKTATRFTGCTRGLNFRYDQRIILDTLQDVDGVSTYTFNIGDRLVRTLESANNKIAVVYDWNPTTKELFVVFQIDELAFIDGGTPGEKSAVAFDGGITDSTNSFELPHVVIDSEGDVIYRLTEPLSLFQDKTFEDDDELSGVGDGLPDLVNTGTAYEGQISLDGGNQSSLYGIEETQGGTNTTLFEIGDQIKDASLPFKTATITDASQLDEGVDHNALIEIKMDKTNPSNYNNINFIIGETVTGVESLIEATVVSWDASTATLILKDPVPYDTGDPDIGLLYEFSKNSTVVGIRIMESGFGYTTTPPNVNIAGSIVDATATASLTADQVTSITVGIGGYGYTTPPAVSFSGGSGSGTVAQAILGGEKITGSNGASWRIGSIDYITAVRNDQF